ncbi:MAG: DnaJ C-terminal domain-containing protein, partial [Cyanobacteriota bacterium]|nr:DnaJ C-terminal domain-containing protein [Cyanobacteriota bacterium]
YWQVLGLEPGADPARLKRAFREQARRWHPDLNGNDPVAEERFKRVNEAYAVLSDPRRRQAWESGEELGENGEPGIPDDPFARGFPDFETYLDALDGRPDEPPPPPESRVTPSPPPPPPVPAASAEETLVELTPDQALAGDRVELELADGTVVEVWTPPLAGDGWRLRLPGLGPGGGDHFLHLRVRTEEGLRIDGLRVLFTLELTPSDAALGGQMLVPTLEGPVRMRVPPGSSSGRLLRLRGRGLRLGEQTGDQIIELRIVVPPELSEAEEALYRRLRELAASG